MSFHEENLFFYSNNLLAVFSFFFLLTNVFNYIHLQTPPFSSALHFGGTYGWSDFTWLSTAQVEE